MSVPPQMAYVGTPLWFVLFGLKRFKLLVWACRIQVMALNHSFCGVQLGYCHCSEYSFPSPYLKSIWRSNSRLGLQECWIRGLHTSTQGIEALANWLGKECLVIHHSAPLHNFLYLKFRHTIVTFKPLYWLARGKYQMLRRRSVLHWCNFFCVETVVLLLDCNQFYLEIMF